MAKGMSPETASALEGYYHGTGATVPPDVQRVIEQAQEKPPARRIRIKPGEKVTLPKPAGKIGK